MRLRNHALNGVWESRLCFGQPGRSDIRMLLSSSDSEGPLPRFRESWSAVGGLGSWSALFRCYAAGWSDVTGAHVTCGATWKPRRCIAESKDTVSQMIGPTRHRFLGVQGLSTPENFHSTALQSLRFLMFTHIPQAGCAALRLLILDCQCFMVYLEKVSLQPGWFPQSGISLLPDTDFWPWFPLRRLVPSLRCVVAGTQIHAHPDPNKLATLPHMRGGRFLLYEADMQWRCWSSGASSGQSLNAQSAVCFILCCAY